MTIPVTVYTKPNCQPCRAVKRWLTERDIPFEEADATTPDNTAAIRYLGYQQAPVVIITPDGPKSEVRFSGFNPTALEQYLGKDAA